MLSHIASQQNLCFDFRPFVFSLFSRQARILVYRFDFETWYTLMVMTFAYLSNMYFCVLSLHEDHNAQTVQTNRDLASVLLNRKTLIMQCSCVYWFWVSFSLKWDYNVTTVKVHSLNDTLWETFENIHLNKLSSEIHTISKTSDLVSCHKLRFVLLRNSNNKSVQ